MNVDIEFAFDELAVRTFEFPAVPHRLPDETKLIKQFDSI